jgi:MFS family permease
LITEEDNKGFLRYAINFLQRQESPFKVNMLRNVSQSLAQNLTYQYQSIYMVSLGASPLILGYINSMSGVINASLSVPGGALADKLGIKKILLFVLSFYLLSSALFSFSYTWQTAAAALLVFTVAFTLDRTTCPMICGSTLSSEERVTGMGFCDTISFAPQIVAPLIGAALITLFGGMYANGIRPVFYIQTTLMLIPLLIIWFKFTNPRHHIVGRKESIFSNIKNVLNEGSMIKRWIILTMLNSFWWQVAFYIPLFAAEIKGANQFIVGGMSTAATITSVGLAIPLGRLADRKGRKKMMTIYGSLVCMSYLLLIYAPNDPLLLLAGFLNGFTMLNGQTQTATAVELVPRQYLGSWLGLLGLFRGLVSIASPIISGFVWDIVSPGSVFLLLLLTQIGGLMTLWTIPTKITK